MSGVEWVVSKMGKFKGAMFFSRIKDIEVVSKEGESLGKVKDLIFNTSSFLGVVVKYRGRRIVVDKEFILSIKDKVVLRETIILSYLGKRVYSKEGEYLGMVVDIIRESKGNEGIKLIVRKKFRKREVSFKDIAIAKRNIILRR